MAITNAEYQEINKILVEIIGKDEDTLQSAWVEILEQKTTDKDSIQQIAKKLKRQNTNQAIAAKYKETSIDKPLGKESDDDFTLKDVIPDKTPVIDLDDSSVKDTPKRLWKPNKKAQLRLDEESANVLKKKYPNMTYSEAVRAILHLPYIPKRNVWQPWEDDLVKDRYAWGGSLAVSVDVARSLDCIRERARFLGIKRDKYKPNASWLTSKEVGAIFQCHFTEVLKWAKKGFITSIAIPGKKYGFAFFEESAVANFITSHPFTYDHWRVQGKYRDSVPDWLYHWETLNNTQKTHYVSKSWLLSKIKQNQLEYKQGYAGNMYVKGEDVKKLLNNPLPRKSKKQLHKVYEVESTVSNNANAKLIRHYLGTTETQQEHNIILFHPLCDERFEHTYKFLGSNGKRYQVAHIVRGYPTCKRCLKILKAEQTRKVK